MSSSITAPIPVMTYSSTTTHDSRHERRLSFASFDLPPSYTAEPAIPLPEYTLHAPEPVTLAMYLFKFGFCEYTKKLYFLFMRLNTLLHSVPPILVVRSYHSAFTTTRTTYVIKLRLRLRPRLGSGSGDCNSNVVDARKNGGRTTEDDSGYSKGGSEVGVEMSCCVFGTRWGCCWSCCFCVGFHVTPTALISFSLFHFFTSHCALFYYYYQHCPICIKL